MSGDKNAFGTSCLCIPRRIYIVIFCFVMGAMCWLQILRWLWGSNLIDNLLGEPPKPVLGCSGPECWNMFTCDAMKAATLHIREPVTSLFGAIFYPIGFMGASRSWGGYIELFWYYIVASAVLHLCLIPCDYSYIQRCNAYPVNVIEHSLLQHLPPSPLSQDTQVAIRQTTDLSIQNIQQLTNGFHIQAWYFAIFGGWAFLLSYTAIQVWLLLFWTQEGPIGMGVNYGVDQWDEVLDIDALRRQKNRESRSRFLDDARQPILSPEWGSSYGYSAKKSYGTTDEEKDEPEPIYKDTSDGWLEEGAQQESLEETHHDLQEVIIHPRPLFPQQGEVFQRMQLPQTQPQLSVNQMPTLSSINLDDDDDDDDDNGEEAIARQLAAEQEAEVARQLAEMIAAEEGFENHGLFA